MEVLQGTARRQQAQLEQLVGEYRGQLNLVMDKQNKTEELVSSLQSDLRSIKSGMHERLCSTEEKLEQLQSLYTLELGTHQEELRAEVRAELQKLESTTAESAAGQSSLRAAAPVFVPVSESEVDIGGVGGAPQMLHRPMMYDGKTAWDAYFTQFELPDELLETQGESHATFNQSTRVSCNSSDELACRSTR